MDAVYRKLQKSWSSAPCTRGMALLCYAILPSHSCASRAGPMRRRHLSMTQRRGDSHALQGVGTIRESYTNGSHPLSHPRTTVNISAKSQCHEPCYYSQDPTWYIKLIPQPRTSWKYVVGNLLPMDYRSTLWCKVKNHWVMPTSDPQGRL